MDHRKLDTLIIDDKAEWFPQNMSQRNKEIKNIKENLKGREDSSRCSNICHILVLET